MPGVSKAVVCGTDIILEINITRSQSEEELYICIRNDCVYLTIVNTMLSQIGPADIALTVPTTPPPEPSTPPTSRSYLSGLY